MTNIERAEEAVRFKHSGFNCCQAVAMAFRDVTGAPEEMTKLTAGFGVGMGCMEATCGALIGAGLVAGAFTGGKGTMPLTKALLKDFEQRCGATICGDLKGVKTGKVLCPCDECVKNAVLALCELTGI